MSEPVKTNLLKAMEVALRAGLPEIATVRREFDLPFDLKATDEAGALLCPAPALFFWEEPEDSEEDNLITRNKLNLSLVVFVELSGILGDGQTPTFQEFADAAEVLALPLKSLMVDRDNLASWKTLGLLNLEITGVSKALSNQEYGEMVLTFRLEYWHRLGDASSLNLQ